jgi:hypothetical protein
MADAEEETADADAAPAPAQPAWHKHARCAAAVEGKCYWVQKKEKVQMGEGEGQDARRHLPFPSPLAACSLLVPSIDRAKSYIRSDSMCFASRPMYSTWQINAPGLPDEDLTSSPTRAEVVDNYATE